ncbi:fused MFS/spermidine synthase [Pusillimonas sp. SM2304]|uniref:spermidine synthase n=1 Tax=Pusillimonas sp. SM2304 TaxID=3073241 RepID=UPI002874FB81|nr:fused MFS/spermidine synthase [Pusillimonas sp. SM2304]MDS1141558.1 fused MFS/spermidine synthase [Pusillimonas sp. SM2304]
MFKRHPFLFAAAAGALAAGAALALFVYTQAASPATRLVHTEPSEFAPVVVLEEFGQRCMNFNTIEDNGRHTCIELDNPDKMVFGYTRMMTTALFVKPDPQSVLVVGLGGATLPLALEKILPGAVIDSIEIDPAVARVAERFFGYRQGPRQRLFVEDGRAFVERARREGRRYDMIMLDAFDVDYIPAHLLTRQFLEHVRAILSPDGVLAANSFTTSGMYDRESVTYAAVFGDFYNLRAESRYVTANRVIVATRGPLPDRTVVARNATALASTLARFGINAEQALERFSTERNWNEDAAILTD